MEQIKTLLSKILIPLHPSGLMYITGFAVVSLILGTLWEPLGIIGLFLTLWCVWFFRDPIRVSPQREGLVLAPLTA